MTGQITTGGQMLSTYDLQTGAPVPGDTSRYSTGEAAWAFALCTTSSPPRAGTGRPAASSTTCRRVRDEVEDLPYRPWADQWAAYTLAELAPRTGWPSTMSTYARALAERFGMLVRTESQKDSWPVAFVDPRARGGGLGVWLEGLGSLAGRRRARRPISRTSASPFPSAWSAAPASSADRQEDAADAAEWPSPDLVEGALVPRRRHPDGRPATRPVRTAGGSRPRRPGGLVRQP